MLNLQIFHGVALLTVPTILFEHRVERNLSHNRSGQ